MTGTYHLAPAVLEDPAIRRDRSVHGRSGGGVEQLAGNLEPFPGMLPVPEVDDWRRHVEKIS